MHSRVDKVYFAALNSYLEQGEPPRARELQSHFIETEDVVISMRDCSLGLARLKKMISDLHGGLEQEAAANIGYKVTAMVLEAAKSKNGDADNDEVKKINHQALFALQAAMDESIERVQSTVNSITSDLSVSDMSALNRSVADMQGRMTQIIESIQKLNN